MPDPATPSPHDRRWRAALSGAVALYLFLGIALILRHPGLQYDEALLVLGSVHMLNSPGVLALPHDPDTWACAFGRCFPLMTVRYVGALKEYLFLPIAAVSHSPAAALRLLSLLLSAIGIWGMGRLLASEISPRAGAISAWLLALCPAFLSFNVFDNGAVSVMMAAWGLLFLAVKRYLGAPGAAAAFLVGLAAGLGVWSRANFVWVLAAFGAACIVVAGKRLAARPRHWTMAALGGIAGALPFLAYQVKSRGGTWEAVGMFQAPGTWGERLSVRWVQFSEILLADREHRAMWNGPGTPEWQVWVFPAMVIAALLVCLMARIPAGTPLRGRGRAVGAMFLVLATFLFTSRMAVSEHHLIVLVPVAAAMVSISVEILRRRHKWFGMAGAAAGLLYAGSALQWHRLALEGLEQTGGVSVWSDGIYTLAEHLEQVSASRGVKILDWGLQNNLYVLTRGRLRSREIFGDATRERSGLGRGWREEVSDGGVFIMFPASHRQFPVASEAFLDAVKALGLNPRQSVIREKTGAVFVEVYEIDPGAAPSGPGAASDLPATSRISMNDPRAAAHIEGFHQIEENAWRWTKRQFAVTLAAPGNAADSKLVMKLFVPPVVIDRLGPVTLNARANGVDLGPETFSKSGIYNYSRNLDGPLKTGPVRVEFSLDKSLAPTAGEGRELGMIVHSTEILPR